MFLSRHMIGPKYEVHGEVGIDVIPDLAARDCPIPQFLDAASSDIASAGRRWKRGSEEEIPVGRAGIHDLAGGWCGDPG